MTRATGAVSIASALDYALLRGSKWMVTRPVMTRRLGAERGSLDDWEDRGW